MLTVDVLGLVRLAPNFSTCAGLGQSADGLSWIGSHIMDPWTTLIDTLEDVGNGFSNSHTLPFPCNQFPFLCIPFPIL